ncbi:hypothetical protein PMIN06_001067 [Paraphaeosphaeria minitans]
MGPYRYVPTRRLRHATLTFSRRTHAEALPCPLWQRTGSVPVASSPCPLWQLRHVLCGSFAMSLVAASPSPLWQLHAHVLSTAARPLLSRLVYSCNDALFSRQHLKCLLLLPESPTRSTASPEAEARLLDLTQSPKSANLPARAVASSHDDLCSYLHLPSFTLVS